MSALNNQPDDDAQAVTSTEHRAVHAAVFDPPQKVSEFQLRKTGVDVEMLTVTYETTVRPYLDYLHGYQDIRTLDPQAKARAITNSRWDASLQAMISPEPWEHVLFRAGVHERNLNMSVLDVFPGFTHWISFRRQQTSPDETRIRLYLTRKGQWVLWYERWSLAKDQQRFLAPERVYWFESLEGLVEELLELFPGGRRGYWVAPNGIMKLNCRSLPLIIEVYLRELLRETINTRRRRLASMEAQLDKANETAARIQPHNNHLT